MSWSLNAYGHADDPEQEKDLAAKLGQVLKDAGPAVSSATHSSSGYNGDPRDLAAPPPTA